MKDGRWEVLIFPYNADEARWFPVPDRAVLRRENPDGRPILCRRQMDLSAASYRRRAPEDTCTQSGE